MTQLSHIAGMTKLADAQVSQVQAMHLLGPVPSFAVPHVLLCLQSTHVDRALRSWHALHPCDASEHIVQVLAKKFGEAAENEIEHMKWLTFKDLEKSMAEDIKLLHESPLISDTIAIHGLIYDVSIWIAMLDCSVELACMAFTPAADALAGA